MNRCPVMDGREGWGGGIFDFDTMSTMISRYYSTVVNSETQKPVF